jgi:hypothetical protein
MFTKFLQNDRAFPPCQKAENSLSFYSGPGPRLFPGMRFSGQRMPYFGSLKKKFTENTTSCASLPKINQDIDFTPFE